MDIFVSPKKILTRYECGSQVRGFPLWVGSLSERRRLDDGEYRGFNGLVTLHVRRWFGIWQPLNLPEAITSAVERFLKEFHAPQDYNFDCYSFATLVVGLPLHNKEYLIDYWKVKKVRLRRFRRGDIIFLVSERQQRFGHAAVCIGKGYFLSVQGAGGSLSVSTLSDLRKLYKASGHSDTLLATPR